MDRSALPPVLCVFEDERFPNFFPLSLDRPVFDLDIGTHTLRGRLVDELAPAALALVCRPYLGDTLAERATAGEVGRPVSVNALPPGEALFLNGRILAFGDECAELCASIPPDTILHKKGVVVAARLSAERAKSFVTFLAGPLSMETIARVIQEIKDRSVAPEEDEGREEETARDEERGAAVSTWAHRHRAKLVETNVRLITYHWQLIEENRECILDDFRKNPLRGTAPGTELFRGVELIGEEDILIGPDAQVRSGTVLDASEGAIVISRGVCIEPNAIVHGPCFIGEGTIVRGGATIGHGTTIGAQCRVGGEIEECVFSPFTNKQHEGFMGHSYVGSWVNIGAGSVTSDLKSNYGLVRTWTAGRMRDTGRRFLGAVIGDHAKIAVNSRLNSGTVVGFGAYITDVGFPPKMVPSFTWQLTPAFVMAELKAVVETAGIMMDRRNVRFTAADSELFKTIFRFCRQSGNAI